MRLIDADELMEHVWRDKLNSRELIAAMIENAPTINNTVTDATPKSAEMKSYATYIEIINALIDKNESDSYELIQMVDDISSSDFNYSLACKYLERLHIRTRDLLDIITEALAISKKRRMNDDT